MGSISAFVSAATSQLGVPYHYGDENPRGDSTPGEGFDCSGLTQYSASVAGLSLPRTARAQQQATTPVTNPQPGDLVFFGAPAHHVGIYLGGGKMLHAPHTGEVVQISSVGNPTGYGRIKGAVSSTVTSAVSTAASTVGLDLGFGDLAAKLGVLLTKGLFVILGLSLVGVGVWRAVATGGERP